MNKLNEECLISKMSFTDEGKFIQASFTNLTIFSHKFKQKKTHTFIIIYQGMEENFINSGIVKKRVYNRLTNLLVESYTLWPPSSPDISPSDFMLWSHLRKRLVYSNPS